MECINSRNLVEDGPDLDLSFAEWLMGKASHGKSHWVSCSQENLNDCNNRNDERTGIQHYKRFLQVSAGRDYVIILHKPETTQNFCSCRLNRNINWQHTGENILNGKNTNTDRCKAKSGYNFCQMLWDKHYSLTRMTSDWTILDSSKSTLNQADRSKMVQNYWWPEQSSVTSELEIKLGREVSSHCKYQNERRKWRECTLW